MKLSEKVTSEQPVTDDEISAYFNEKKEELSEEYREDGIFIKAYVDSSFNI